MIGMSHHVCPQLYQPVYTSLEIKHFWHLCVWCFCLCAHMCYHIHVEAWGKLWESALSLHPWVPQIELDHQAWCRDFPAEPSPHPSVSKNIVEIQQPAVLLGSNKMQVKQPCAGSRGEHGGRYMSFCIVHTQEAPGDQGFFSNLGLRKLQSWSGGLLCKLSSVSWGTSPCKAAPSWGAHGPNWYLSEKRYALLLKPWLEPLCFRTFLKSLHCDPQRTIWEHLPK